MQEDLPYVQQNGSAESHMGGVRSLPPVLGVMHATAGTNSLAWLSGASSPPVSCHVLIDRSGVIYRIVPDNRVAWHAGVSSWARYGTEGWPSINEVSLGMELENTNDGSEPYTDVQIMSAAQVFALWQWQYGQFPIVSHAQIAPGRKSDPFLFPWDIFRSRLRNALQVLASEAQTAY